VAIVGLATEYCVKFTALDARRLGFETRLIREGVRGVELNPGDCEKAYTAMRDAGVSIVGVEDI
jgi:nicotinamidase/pyrazinamidase